MRASVSTALTEAHQQVDLAVLLMPEAAFLVLGYLVYHPVVASIYNVYGAVVGARVLKQELVRE